MKRLINKAVPKTVGALLNASSLVSSKYAAAKALSLFATPRKGDINQKQASFLNSAKKETLNCKGNAIMTYQWDGHNKTVLLSHGWESNTSRWQGLIALLQSKNFNIIALDAPAHGESESKTFNAILYSEFINVVCNHYNPEIIIGHSVGGMASVIFQHNYQLQSLNKLVLLGAPSEFEGILKNYTDMLSYNSKVIKSLDKLIEDNFGASPSAFSTAKYCKSINVDGLIIHDIKDKIIPYSEAELIHKNFKNSKLIATTGFGHSLNHKVVYNYIVEFINSSNIENK